MSEPANVPNALDDVLERLSHASSQIVKAVEDQTRHIDQWTKDFVDRSEAATERLLKRFEQQSRARSTRSDARSRSSNVEPVRSGRRHR